MVRYNENVLYINPAIFNGWVILIRSWSMQGVAHIPGLVEEVLFIKRRSNNPHTMINCHLLDDYNCLYWLGSNQVFTFLYLLQISHLFSGPLEGCRNNLLHENGKGLRVLLLTLVGLKVGLMLVISPGVEMFVNMAGCPFFRCGENIKAGKMRGKSHARKVSVPCAVCRVPHNSTYTL